MTAVKLMQLMEKHKKTNRNRANARFLDKVLVELFQKLVGVWGQSPRERTLFSF
jgi:hypothetical protein